MKLLESGMVPMPLPKNLYEKNPSLNDFNGFENRRY